MIFSLSPNDPTFNSLYNQINWNNAISFDFQVQSKTT